MGRTKEEEKDMSKILDSNFAAATAHQSSFAKKAQAPAAEIMAPAPAIAPPIEGEDTQISLSDQAQSLLAEEKDPETKGKKQGEGEWKNHGQMVSYAAKNGIHGQDLSQIAKGDVEGLTKEDMNRVGNGELTLAELLEEKAKAAEAAAQKAAEKPAETPAPAPAPEAETAAQPQAVTVAVAEPTQEQLA
jgi:hypothetical protein